MYSVHAGSISDRLWNSALSTFKRLCNCKYLRYLKPQVSFVKLNGSDSWPTCFPTQFLDQQRAFGTTCCTDLETTCCLGYKVDKSEPGLNRHVSFLSSGRGLINSQTHDHVSRPQAPVKGILAFFHIVEVLPLCNLNIIVIWRLSGEVYSAGGSVF